MPTLDDLARRVGGRLDGPADLEIERVAPVDGAGPKDLTFAKDARHLERVRAGRAGAVLCREEDDVAGRPAIRVANPRLAAARLIGEFEPAPRPPSGRHPSAVVADDVRLPASASIGPLAVIEAGSRLGEGVVVEAHTVVGAGCRVGDGTWLHAGVVLYPGVVLGRRCEVHAGAVIGSSGFGVEMGEDGPVEFPQRGSVVLGDDVRVGANTTIDRATFDATRLGDGVKLDNLVQVGHNVRIEDGVIVCALAGLGGGAALERRAVLGPQGALAPDAVLGPGTILGARGALQSHGRLDDPGRVYMGTPPIPVEDWRRWVVVRRRWRRGKRL